MSNKKLTDHILIRIDEDMKGQIAKLAKNNDRSESYIGRKLLEKGLREEFNDLKGKRA